MAQHLQGLNHVSTSNTQRDPPRRCHHPLDRTVLTDTIVLIGLGLGRHTHHRVLHPRPSSIAHHPHLQGITMYTINFLLRTHGDHHERRTIDCTIKQLQATLTRLSKDRNVRDIWWSKQGQDVPV